MLEQQRPPEESRQQDSLFGDVLYPATAYPEARHTSGSTRTPWLELVNAFESLGAEGLRDRQRRLERLRREDGETYDLFDEGQEKRTSWALDLVPLPVTARDWSIVESGIKQRARVLQLLLNDIYGPQKIIGLGLLPPEVLFANPNFLRPCHGITPASGNYLEFYAADIYRDQNGSFRVLRDYGSNPAGLGYCLENRIVISRVLSELYQDANVLRLAPFFRVLSQNLNLQARLDLEDPGVVLLSPGPESNVYFEQALLSRYLGYPLVESQDLTVRNGHVYMRKLAGLEPVDVVLRQLSDQQSDPFALRKKGGDGVAGLIQASREQSVHLVNPIGSGFIDTPALGAFMQNLCRYFEGTDLLLPDHPTWWLGNPDNRTGEVVDPDRLTLGPAMRWSDATTAPTPEEIEASPYLFLAREPLLPSVAPAWVGGAMISHYTVWRVFCWATRTGFEVLPGGLAISSADAAELVRGRPEQLQSKDIWVISEEPIETVSLLDKLETVAEFSRGSDLPSRVADNLLWLGRYLERAEGQVRLLRTVYRRLSGEARPLELPELPFLLGLLRGNRSLPPATENPETLPSLGMLNVQLHDALFKKDRPGSIGQVLERIQNTARHVRDRLSTDCWRIISRLEDFYDGEAEDPLDLLDETLFTLSAFSGLAMESITRGLGWRFLDMGRRLERGINLTDLLKDALARGCATDRNNLEVLLEIADSTMTYRSRYRTKLQLEPILDLLLVDDGNPKSLSFQLHQLATHARHLQELAPTGPERPEGRLIQETREAMERLDLNWTPVLGDNPAKPELQKFLDQMRESLQKFAQAITAHYLSRVPTTPHYTLFHRV